MLRVRGVCISLTHGEAARVPAGWPALPSRSTAAVQALACLPVGSRPGRGCPVRLWILILHQSYMSSVASPRPWLFLTSSWRVWCWPCARFVSNSAWSWRGVSDAVEATGAAGTRVAAHASMPPRAPQRHTQPGVREPPLTVATLNGALNGASAAAPGRAETGQTPQGRAGVFLAAVNARVCVCFR